MISSDIQWKGSLLIVTAATSVAQIRTNSFAVTPKGNPNIIHNSSLGGIRFYYLQGGRMLSSRVKSQSSPAASGATVESIGSRL